MYGAPGLEKTRDYVHRATSFYISLLQRLGLAQLSIEGVENLPQGGAILVANHPSRLDMILFLSLIPRCGCLVKKERPLLSPYARIIRLAQYVKADGGQEIVDQASKELAAGRKMVIFPEGTRNVHGANSGGLKFRRGAAALALQSGSPVVPVVLHYDPPVLGRGRKWYDTPKTICKVRIRYFEPLCFKSSSLEQWAERREVTKSLENFFEDQLSQL
jgi:1-acyl-sn-glycerol-3-phosphate acyltransferase